MAKIIIIGGGVAGLTAGVYARLSGYEAEIHEMHSVPGGECTAWDRGGYRFDNCIHWLMGSKPGTALNRLWRDVGALDDSVEIISTDVFTGLEMDGRTAIIYRGLDTFERHLLEMFPGDAEAIHEMCADARKLGKMQMPVECPVDMMKPWQIIGLLAKMLPAMGARNKYTGITLSDFASRFKDPLLRELIARQMPEQYCAMPTLMMLGVLDSGDGGYPVGGSLPFALRIARRFEDLGGKLLLRSKVQSVIVENGRAAGVRLEDGSESRADWVISAADGFHTLRSLLGGAYKDEAMEKMYSDPESYPVYTTIQVNLGINADLSGRPCMLAVPAERPIDAGGRLHTHIPLKNYSFDKTMAPAGKTVVTCALDADYGWWKEKKKDPQAYRAEKERVASEVQAAVEARYPETKGKIEKTDVVTPLTYERYCNAWQGAWMSFMTTPKNSREQGYLPGKLPGLDRFLMAGQWTMWPGGLPGASVSGRWAVQRICKLDKKKFCSAKP